jgi:Short C-terminal domain
MPVTGPVDDGRTAAPPPPPELVAPPADADLVVSLSRLAYLRDRGALTEEEFQAAKARLLT